MYNFVLTHHTPGPSPKEQHAMPKGAQHAPQPSPEQHAQLKVAQNTPGTTLMKNIHRV